MNVVHLTGSPFFGAPERQMLELATHMPADYRTMFLCFADHGKSQAFLDEIHRQGCEGFSLEHDGPHYLRTIAEVKRCLDRLEADILCCHGYKADLLGLPAARRLGIPVIAVSHGWTSATLKVRFNEALDRLSLRWMDRVVCVSEGQAQKVRRAGVPADRVMVIHDAVSCRRFETRDASCRDRLQSMFPTARTRIIGSAGRLSPEKGFGVLVDAAARVVGEDAGVGFVHFGDGPLRAEIEQQIARLGLTDRFILAGFRTDLDQFLPNLDLLVLPSFTEGLPNVVLEAFASSVPVVATAVGGTPELIEDGVNGFLVPPGDPVALACRILNLVGCSEATRRAMGRQGRQRVEERFTFEAQSLEYELLFKRLVPHEAPEPCDTASI